MNIIAALLIFTVIVVIHELGHFFLAKKNGIGVPEFSVGMGPRIITFAKTSNAPVISFFCSQKKFEAREDWQDVTKYSWKLFPIGGSCAMIGEDEENDAENSFNSKGVWARFSVVFAGPFFNFILAFIFSVIILGNTGIDYPIVQYVYDYQPAAQAGIQVGDEIKKINGHKITIGREVNNYLLLHSAKGSDVEIEYVRDGKANAVTFNPEYKTYLFGFTYATEESASAEIADVTSGKAFEKQGIEKGDVIRAINGIEIHNSGDLAKVMNEVKDGSDVTFSIERNGQKKDYKITPEEAVSETLGMYVAGDSQMDGSTAKAEASAIEILKYSFIEVKYWIETTVGSLKQLVLGNISTKEISGPVGIVDTVGDVIDQSKSLGMKAVIVNMLYMAVLLSANLGVMNLLPLPALDGGRLVFILIEAVRGKPIDREKEGLVHFGGFVVLMFFMVFVMYNDIMKLFH